MRYLSLQLTDGIARVTLDAPESRVNVLDGDFMAELDQVAAQLEQTPKLQGVLVHSAKEGGFIAGADLHQIAAIDDPAEGSRLSAEGQRIFGRWAALKVAVVAAVHGHCMGGGTEFILACSARVAATGTSIALPEVRLGLVPGWGGTQRLPRLLSLRRAADLILSGRTVRATEAQHIGLVDRVVPPAELEQAALALLRHLPPRLPAPALRLERWLERVAPLRELLFHFARQRVLGQTGGHYPAPLMALDILRRSYGRSLAEGLQLEAEILGHLVTSSACKNLVHAFFLSERGKKSPPGIAQASPLSTGAVLGAGVMGAGIAQWLAEHGFTVLLKDINREAVAGGLEKVRELFRRRLQRRGQIDRLEERMARVRGTTDYDGFQAAELVIEAVAEKMAVKQLVLREVEPQLAPTAVFATNTSALSVSELQTAAQRPENVGGLHFFNPVHRMPLVEVIRGTHTADSTVAVLFQAARQLDKIPIEVRDRPGFLVNRLLGVYLLEACHLAREEVQWQSLDRQATEFGWPMGPFRLIDEVGIDIIAEVGQTLLDQLDYLQPIDLFRDAAAQGLKGRKGGRGFYHYEGKKIRPNKEVAATLGLPQQRPAQRGDLERMLYLMLNEAARCLDEGVVAAPEDIDTGTLFGLGFPPFRGGLARWADSEGIDAVAQRLEQLQTHGRRFAPAERLLRRERFYQAETGG